MRHGLLYAWSSSLCLCLSWCAVSVAEDPEEKLPTIERRVPAPLSDHPGNIYLEGDSVSLLVGPEISQSAATWILYDAQRLKVTTGEVVSGGVCSSAISIGELPVGWYRLEFSDADGKPAGWTTAAVLKRLAAPTPLDSPVCIDTAMAWFARDDVAEQTRHANLAALAGANWIRDRITWREMESARGRFADRPNNYDRVAQIQCEAGLRVQKAAYLGFNLEE